MERRALITGLAGQQLSDQEREFLAHVRPAGIILFARNLGNHDQIRRLVGDARTAIGAKQTLVLIDQEGGRVQRLRPPLGRALPPASAFAALFADDAGKASKAANSIARLMAHDLTALGINTDCAPVCDLPVKGAHEIIGDRAYGCDVQQVVGLARSVADGLMAGGVLPVIKHIPGHGRAMADSHLSLPTVDTPLGTLIETDFATFRALSGLPAAMTAHVVFSDIDSERPASTSTKVTAEIIRGQIGFDGLLMSDDLGMKALTGPMRERAWGVIAAGSDIALHCNGDLGEMQEAAEAVPVLSGEAYRRFTEALAVTRQCDQFDLEGAEFALEQVLTHWKAHESV